MLPIVICIYIAIFFFIHDMQKIVTSGKFNFSQVLEQGEIDDKKRKPSKEIRVEAMRDAVESTRLRLTRMSASRAGRICSGRRGTAAIDAVDEAGESPAATGVVRPGSAQPARMRVLIRPRRSVRMP